MASCFTLHGAGLELPSQMQKVSFPLLHAEMPGFARVVTGSDSSCLLSMHYLPACIPSRAAGST